MVTGSTGDTPTSPVLPVGQVGGNGDPPALPHAGALQPLVHPGDDVTLPHVGVVGVIAGVAVRQGREGQQVSQSPPPPQLRATPPRCCLGRPQILPQPLPPPSQ